MAVDHHRHGMMISAWVLFEPCIIGNKGTWGRQHERCQSAY